MRLGGASTFPLTPHLAFRSGLASDLCSLKANHKVAKEVLEEGGSGVLGSSVLPLGKVLSLCALRWGAGLGRE